MKKIILFILWSCAAFAQVAKQQELGCLRR